MARVSIFANSTDIVVQACIGLRRTRFNPGVSPMLLPANTDELQLGQASLEALNRYRQLSVEEVADFFSLPRVEAEYEEWVRLLIARLGYRRRQDLFRGLRHCEVEATETMICVRPTRQEGLEAWGGTGKGGEDHVSIPLRTTASELGRAIRIALARCE